MKKKTYQKPAIEIIDVVLSQLIAASPGWSQDGNDPSNVGKEEDGFDKVYVGGNGDKKIQIKAESGSIKIDFE